MSRTLQFRRYPSSQLASITGANGEIIINTTTRSITVHDGVTPGGYVPTSTGADQVARDTANSSLTLAQNAYNYANTIVSDTQIDPYARTTANSALGYANDAIQDSVIAINTANSSLTLAQAAYNYANTIVSDTQIDPYARTTANNASSNISILQGVNATQNTNITNINSTLTVLQDVNAAQNTRLNSIETINTNQNTSIGIIQGVDVTQNTRLNSIETINSNQNTSISILQSVNTSQNTRMTNIELTNNNQDNQIIAVNNFAQSAYDKANTGSSTGNYTFSGNNITLGANATANLVVSGYESSVSTVTYTRNPDGNSDIGHFDYAGIDPSAKTITFYTYGGASLITALVSAYNNGATINVAYDGTDTYNITPGITKYGDIVLTSFTNTSGSTWVGTYNETLTPLTNSTRVFILSWNALVNNLVSKSWLFNNTSLTFPDNTIQTGGSISITELKALVANAATYTDFQTAISNL